MRVHGTDHGTTVWHQGTWAVQPVAFHPVLVQATEGGEGWEARRSVLAAASWATSVLFHVLSFS